MSSLMGPKCFLSSAFFILTILSIYGLVGSVYNYLQRSHLHDDNIGEWPFNTRPIFFAFITIQGLFPLAGFFAVLAICRKRPMFLYGSGSVLLAIFTCSCVFGVVSYHISTQEILESCYKTFRRVSNDSRILEWMNDIQLQHRCCGVYSYKDWYTVESSPGQAEKIPFSCCRNNFPHVKNCGIELDNVSNKTTEENIHSEGCGEKLTSMKREVLERIGIEMCVCGLISLLVAIFVQAGVTRYFLADGNSWSSSKQNGGESPTTSEKLNKNSNGTINNDQNNNHTNFRKDFQSRRKQRSLAKRHRSRDLLGSNFSAHGPFASIHSQGKFVRSSRHMMRGNISKSKSFILGDAHSNLLTPISEEKNPEILRKNVDMLWYQSLDKNMSTLSTTPNDISSMLLPAMILQNKRTGQGLGGGYEYMQAGGVGINDDVFATEHQNTEYTLVNEQTFSSSSSPQDCSTSIINSAVKLPVTAPYETVGAGVVGINSPPSSICKQHHIHKESELLHERSEENKFDMARANELGSTNAATNFHASTENKISEQEVKENGSVITNDDGVLISQQNNNSNASQPSSKFLNPTSSVRSSTLATIQEESESTKGSPINTKGGSPASGLTPESVSPQQTQADLFSSSSDKGETQSDPCSVEVNLANNNMNDLNMPNSVASAEPEPSS